MLNRGIYLNGVDANVYVPYNNVFSEVTTEISMVVLVKMHNVAYTQGIVALGNIKYVGYTNVTDTFETYITDVNGTIYSDRYTTPNFDVDPTNWHLVAGQYDGQYLRTIIDAEIYKEKDIGSIILSAITNVQIGGNAECAGVWLYKRALSLDELDELYRNPDNPPRDGLVLWLPFKEGEGVVCKDYSGYNNHGTMTNCRWVTKKNIGWHFDTFGYEFDSGITYTTTNLSMVVVFKGKQGIRLGDTVHGRGCILQLSGDVNMVWLREYDPELKPAISTTIYDGTSWKEIHADIETLKTYVAIVVFNGNEEHIYLYDKGVLIDHVYRTDILSGATLEYTNRKVAIGSTIEYVSGAKYPLHGNVIAAMIYNRVLSEDERMYLADNGWKSPITNGLIFHVPLYRFKEGDTVTDTVNNVEGVKIGNPTPVIRLPER